MAAPPAPAPAPAPAPVRLRLVFDSRRLLRRAQRDDGLRRCWVLLRPEHETVADLAAHVTSHFRLRSCPGGVIFLMDGFALPPFESTCIFRDQDIIRVKQKSRKKMAGHNGVHCIQDPDIVEQRPLPIDDEILLIEYENKSCKQQEELGGDHEPVENATVENNLGNGNTSLKRKCHDDDAGVPESSKKKMLKVTHPGKHIDCSKKDVNRLQDQSRTKKLATSSIEIEAKTHTLCAETTVSMEEEKNIERNNQVMLNSETKVVDSSSQSDTKKLESRSARRKKLKRQLKRQAKAQLEKSVQKESASAVVCPSSNNQDGLPRPSTIQNESQVPLSSHRTDEEESDSSEDIVPVVVRPGHIRFEPAGGEPEKSPAKETQGTFQWSGTMSKKKGQKWGMDNSNKKNTCMNYQTGATGNRTEINYHVVDSKIVKSGFCCVSDHDCGECSINEAANVKSIADKGKSCGGPLDFESFYPLTRLPKEGDLIAYRLVELSSSWCPEISSYRVGKVMIYDPISLRIILSPVPEYPIVNEESKPGDVPGILDMSPYKEDGSLEIEYSSLLDVRLLKGNDSAPEAVSYPLVDTGKNVGSLAGKPVTLDISKGSIHSQVPNKSRDQEATSAKTKDKVWEENGGPLNGKPDAQENGWGTWTPNASTSAWSYRALRSSALGPTVAMLRGKRSQRGKPFNQKRLKS